MASPLILKIQSELDKRGFRDFQNELRKFGQALTNVARLGGALAITFSNLGRVLLTAFSIDVTRRVVALAIETERLNAQLESFFTLIGEDGESITRQFRVLTDEMARNSRFTQNELLVALRNLATTFQSADEASRALAVAQELAAATGQSVVSVSNAIRQANVGLGVSLANLTGIERDRIRTLVEEGRLLDELQRRARTAGALARDVSTISGQLAILNNRLLQTRREFGEALLSVVPVQQFLQLANSLDENVLLLAQVSFLLPGITGGFSVLSLILRRTGLAVGGLGRALLLVTSALGALTVGATLGVTAQILLRREARRLEAEADRLRRRLEGVNAVLGRTREESQSAFNSVGEEIEARSNAIAFLNEQLDNLVDRQGASAQLIRDQIREQAEVIAELRDAQRAAAVQGEIDLEREAQRLERLTLTEVQANRRRLQRDQEFTDLRLRNERLDQDERLALIRRAASNQIQIEALNQQERLELIEQEVTRRRQLLDLITSLQRPLPEDADDEARVRRFDQLVRLLRLEEAQLAREREAAIDTAAQESTIRERALRQTRLERQARITGLQEEQGLLEQNTQRLEAERSALSVAVREGQADRQQLADVDRQISDNRARLVGIQQDINEEVRRGAEEEQELLRVREDAERRIADIARQADAERLRRLQDFQQQFEALGEIESRPDLAERLSRRAESLAGSIERSIRAETNLLQRREALANKREELSQLETDVSREAVARITQTLTEFDRRVDRVREAILGPDAGILQQLREEISAQPVGVNVNVELDAATRTELIQATIQEINRLARAREDRARQSAIPEDFSEITALP